MDAVSIPAHEEAWLRACDPTHPSLPENVEAERERDAEWATCPALPFCWACGTTHLPSVTCIPRSE